MRSFMKRILLNYIYLSRKHAGGKDQVGLNLLKGFYENGFSKNMLIICYDYSVEVIRALAPDIEICQIKSKKMKSEFSRLFFQMYFNTIYLPRIVKKKEVSCLFHLSINNGLRKLPCKTVTLPHDIKQIAHRKIGRQKISTYKYLLYKIIYYLDFVHADQIIAISECDKNDICQYYPQFVSKVTRIYNPIMLSEYNTTILPVSFPYILAVNIQFLHKNTITLIKAYENIQNEITQKLVLVGNIPERVNFLVEYVKEHHLEENVIFTGLVSDQEMDYWIRNADLYVNPTLFEGFGMTAVEAIWKQTPCLVSDIAVNKEITKGLCHYYGPADDINALSTKILICLRESLSPDKLSAASEEMKASYNYHFISKEYINCFKRVIKENSDNDKCNYSSV